MNNKKGQMFVSLLLFIMAIIIYILAAPMLFDIISVNVGGMGTATAFIVKLFMWTIFLTLIAYFLSIINSGQGFFTK